MSKNPKDFQRAINNARGIDLNGKVGRDPKTITDPEAYMRAYLRVGEQIKRSKQNAGH